MFPHFFDITARSYYIEIEVDSEPGRDDDDVPGLGGSPVVPGLNQCYTAATSPSYTEDKTMSKPSHQECPRVDVRRSFHLGWRFSSDDLIYDAVFYDAVLYDAVLYYTIVCHPAMFMWAVGKYKFLSYNQKLLPSLGV
jgi:hypothetical protein